MNPKGANILLVRRLRGAVIGGFKIRTLYSNSSLRARNSACRERGTVYVHWPYCSQLCTYCNFNKYVREHVDHKRMAKCLVNEVSTLLKSSSILEVTSVYFGGGTPSLAEPGTVSAVVEEIAHCVHLPSDAEICLEANPTSAEVQKLSDFKAAGVNRLSLGVQSLSDIDLKLFNRDHTAKEAIQALSEARKLFPGVTNTDMMFGRPGQTCSAWLQELTQVLEVCDNHLSLYQLTVEPGTPLAKSVTTGTLVLPEPDIVADMYEAAIQVLEQAGLLRYEISNFARIGSESRHNISYWTGVDYIGIGPGAHSRFMNTNSQDALCEFTHTVNILEPNHWMKQVLSLGQGVKKTEKLTMHQRLEEVVATSMRTSQGLTNEIWNSFGAVTPLQQVFSTTNSSEGLRQLYDAGFLLLDSRGIRATRQGLKVVDSILPLLFIAMEDVMNQREVTSTALL